MTCRELERRLEAWLSGELPVAARDACARHAAACPECRELVELAGGPFQEAPVAAAPAPDSPAPAPAPDLAPDLVGGVLARTTGPACGRAREELVALVDGELPAARRELMELHLASCPDCRGLHGVLVELSRDLPALAEVDPGPGFVAGVLARTGAGTSGAGETVPGTAPGPAPLDRLRRWWAAAWPRLVRRPRFAWEFAYVLALLLTPLVASAGSPREAAEMVGRAGRIGGQTAASAARGVAVTAEGAAERAGSLGEAAEGELRTFRQRFASSLERGRNDGPRQADDPNPSKGDAR